VDSDKPLEKEEQAGKHRRPLPVLQRKGGEKGGGVVFLVVLVSEEGEKETGEPFYSSSPRGEKRKRLRQER